MPADLGKVFAQLPIGYAADVINTMTACAESGNLLADVLAGDMKQPLRTGYGVGGSQYSTLDGLDQTGVTKFTYFLWLIGQYFEGVNGQVVPDITYTIPGGGVVTITDSADVRALVQAWIFTIQFPLNNVTPTSVSIVRTMADIVSDPIVHNFQISPCGISAMLLNFPFTIVKTAFGAATQTCSIFPTKARPGIPRIQTGGAYTVGGQVPVETHVATGLPGTTIRKRSLTTISGELRQLANMSHDIFSDAFAPQIARKLMNEMDKIQNGARTAVTEAQTPVALQQTPLVQEVLNGGNGHRSYFPMNNGGFNGLAQGYVLDRPAIGTLPGAINRWMGQQRGA